MKKPFILIFAFLLIGCNKTKDIETYILYSNRYETNGSVLIGYNENGHINKEVELDGFKYQNIGVFQDVLYVNNGNNMYTFDNNLNIISEMNNEYYTDSSIEMSGFNSNNDTFYHIDNVGYTDNTYINHVFIGTERSKIVIEGFITAHFLIKDNAFFVYQDTSQIEVGIFDQYYAKVDLNTNSIIDQGKLDDLPPCFSVSGQPYNTDKDTIFFIIDSYDESEIDNIDRTIKTVLVKYNIETMRVVDLYELSSFAETMIFDSKHLLKSNSVYFNDEMIEILYNDGTVLTLNESFEKIDESTIKALSTIDPVLTHFDSSNHVLSILNFNNNEPTLYEFYLSTKETKTKSFEKSDETLDLVPYHFVRKKVDTTQF